MANPTIRPTTPPRRRRPGRPGAPAVVMLAGVVALLGACGGSSAPADLAEGRRLYAAHCAACHGTDGRGGRQGTLRVPSLVGVDRLFEDPGDQARFVANGGGGMPRFADVLSAGEIEAVVAYTRARFGDDGARSPGG